MTRQQKSAWGSLPSLSFKETDPARPYQDKAVSFLIDRNGRGVVRAPTGSGKTYTALKAVSTLGFRRCIIAVRRYSGMLTWIENIAKFGLDTQCDIVIIEKWAKHARIDFWKSKPERPQFVIITYASLIRDKPEIDKYSIHDAVIGDECHQVQDRRIKSSKTIKRLVRDPKCVAIFLSDTPMSRGPHNLWSILNMLSPKVFNSYWDFVERYCVSEEGFKGTSIIGVRASTKRELTARLSGFVCNITDAEVKGFVPDRVRTPLYLPPLTGRDKKFYDTLGVDLVAKTKTGNIILTPNSMVATLRLRQFLICPALIETKLGWGDAIEEIISHASNNDPNFHIGIVSEFVSAFPHWQRYLDSVAVKNNKPTLQHFTIKGGMSALELQAVLRDFALCKQRNIPSVLLMGSAVAESFDVLSCDTAYMLGFPWSAIMNRQAEGRFTRGNKPFCKFFYCIRQDSVEQSVLTTLNTNTRNTTAITNLNEWLKQ